MIINFLCLVKGTNLTIFLNYIFIIIYVFLLGYSYIYILDVFYSLDGSMCVILRQNIDSSNN